jgi:hypothetical protein
MATAAQLARASGARLFRMSAVSGLVTGVSADGVILAHRNPSAEVNQTPIEIRVKARTVAGFTAAQELAVAGHWVTAFDAASPANYAGGTDLSNPASNPAYVNLSVPLDTNYSYTDERTKSVLVTGNVRIATTAALTHAGTPVIKSQPFAWDSFSELAAAATVNKGFADFVWRPSNGSEISLGSNAGFIIKLPVGLGAGGTVRYAVEYVWAERW